MSKNWTNTKNKKLWRSYQRGKGFGRSKKCPNLSATKIGSH